LIKKNNILSQERLEGGLLELSIKILSEITLRKWRISLSLGLLECLLAVSDLLKVKLTVVSRRQMLEVKQVFFLFRDKEN
jgi:hypothetical protein